MEQGRRRLVAVRSVGEAAVGAVPPHGDLEDPDGPAVERTGAAPSPPVGPPAQDGRDGGAGWAVDAAVGSAALVARAGGAVLGAVAGSAPARAAAGLTRRLVAPLSQQGAEVRTAVTVAAGPTVGDALRHYTPGVVEAVDLDAVLGAVDLDALLSRIDVDGLLDRVGVDRLLDRVDVAALLDRVDVAALLDRVDVAALLERVDLDEVLARVDLDVLLRDVDLDALLAKVDVGALVGRMDVNAVVEQVDIDALVRSTELGAIIAQSTTGVASEALDAARSQGVGLDNVLGRVVDRVLRRDPADRPAGPPLLVGPSTSAPDASAPPALPDPPVPSGLPEPPRAT